MEVCAEMLATVWRLRVTVGSEVAEGEELITLESMKMEIPVVAPAAGTVAEILVSQGQAVDEDDVLVRLEPRT